MALLGGQSVKRPLEFMILRSPERGGEFGQELLKDRSGSSSGGQGGDEPPDVRMWTGRGSVHELGCVSRVTTHLLEGAGQGFAAPAFLNGPLDFRECPSP